MSYITVPAHLIFSRELPAKYRGIRIFLEIPSLQSLTLDEKAEVIGVSPRTLDRAVHELAALGAYPGWPTKIQQLRPDNKYVPRDARPDFSTKRREGGWFFRIDRPVLENLTPVGAVIYCALQHKTLRYWTDAAGGAKSSLTELAAVLGTDKRTVKKHIYEMEVSGCLIWNSGKFSLPVLTGAAINKPWTARRQLILSSDDRMKLYRSGLTWYDLGRDEALCQEFMLHSPTKVSGDIGSAFGSRLEVSRSVVRGTSAAQVEASNLRKSKQRKADVFTTILQPEELSTTTSPPKAKASAKYSPLTPGFSAKYSPLSAHHIRLITPDIQRGYGTTAPKKRRAYKEPKYKDLSGERPSRTEKTKQPTGLCIPGYINKAFLKSCASDDSHAEQLAVWFMSVARAYGNDLDDAAHRNYTAIFRDLAPLGRKLALPFLSMLDSTAGKGFTTRKVVRISTLYVLLRCRGKCKIEYAAATMVSSGLLALMDILSEPLEAGAGLWAGDAVALFAGTHACINAAWSQIVEDRIELIAAQICPDFSALPGRHGFNAAVRRRLYKHSCLAAVEVDSVDEYNEFFATDLPRSMERRVQLARRKKIDSKSPRKATNGLRLAQ